MNVRLFLLAVPAVLLGARLAVVSPGSAGNRPTAVALTTDKPGHLFSTDENVKLTVAGMSDGKKLLIGRTDPSGKDLGNQEVTVTGGVADLGMLPAGWYHLSGKSDAAEANIDIAVARPRPVQPFRDDSPFGVVAPPHEAKEWPLLGAMGAAWLQWSMAWAYTEVQPGVYWYMPNAPKSYGDPEGYVKDANKLGIRTTLQIRTVPLWANKGKIGSYKETPAEKRTDTYPPDDDHWTSYDKFLAQVVERYKPLGVNHYEIWSEAEGSMFRRWDTTPFPKVEAYQKLIQRAKKVIKEKDPDAKIMAAGDFPDFLKHAEEGYTAQSTFNNKPDEYAGKSLPGIGKAVDIVSTHPYWTDYKSRPRTHYGPEEKNPGRAPDTLKAMMAESLHLAGSRPMWITEVGYGSAVSNQSTENVASNEDGQASLLVRYYLLSHAWGAKKVFWYSWKDRKVGSTLESSYGLLRADGTVKPAYLAYRTMTERMEGLKFVVKESGPNRWIVHGLGPRTVVALWKLKADNKPESLTLPWSRVRVTRRDGGSTIETPVGGKVSIPLRSGEPVFLDQAP